MTSYWGDIMGEITGNNPDLPPGTLRVDPDRMRAWSADTLDIARTFTATGRSVEGEVTDGYVALGQWDSGPALRERWIRWGDQISTLGNRLTDVAERFRRTADNYRAADESAHRQVTGARQVW